MVERVVYREFNKEGMRCAVCGKLLTDVAEEDYVVQVYRLSCDGERYVASYCGLSCREKARRKEDGADGGAGD